MKIKGGRRREGKKACSADPVANVTQPFDMVINLILQTIDERDFFLTVFFVLFVFLIRFLSPFSYSFIFFLKDFQTYIFCLSSNIIIVVVVFFYICGISFPSLFFFPFRSFFSFLSFSYFRSHLSFAFTLSSSFARFFLLLMSLILHFYRSPAY